MFSLPILKMSTKSESNIPTIWNIFKVEICPEAPGEIKLQNIGRGKDENRGDFFLISLGGGGDKKGGNWLFILFLVGGESMLAAMLVGRLFGYSFQFSFYMLNW